MKFIRILFFILIVKPLLLVVLGLNIRNKENLPTDGPAILVANHNSHLDTLVLMNLLGIRNVNKVRPVAAADYFLKNPVIKWFSLGLLNILPISRTAKREKGKGLFHELHVALEKGEILLFFPEGSRGEPEVLSEFKSGIAHLAREHKDVPIYPIFLHGLGKSLPKGDPILVPFFCDIFIGERIYGLDNKNDFMKVLNDRMQSLYEQK